MQTSILKMCLVFEPYISSTRNLTGLYVCNNVQKVKSLYIIHTTSIYKKITYTNFFCNLVNSFNSRLFCSKFCLTCFLYENCCFKRVIVLRTLFRYSYGYFNIGLWAKLTFYNFVRWEGRKACNYYSSVLHVYFKILNITVCISKQT